MDFTFVFIPDVADSYIKISTGLVQLATIDNTDLEKWVSIMVKFNLLSQVVIDASVRKLEEEDCTTLGVCL